MGVKHYLKRVIAAVLNRKPARLPVDEAGLESLLTALAGENQSRQEEIRARLYALLSAQEQTLREQFMRQSNESMARLIDELYRKALTDPLRQVFHAGNGALIPVVMICDDSYAVPTGVAITSLLCNKNPDTRYAVTVLGKTLSEENVQMLSALSPDVTVLCCGEWQGEAYANTHMYVSNAALLKFEIPRLLGAYDKVLYLDSDILVLGDLAKLFATDIDSRYAAVAKDLLGTSFQYHTRTGVSSYFNSGVLLLNTQKMREENITERLYENKAKDTWKMLMDQDAFNITFAENVVWLHPRFNLMYANNLASRWNMKQMASFYGISKREMEETMLHPVILHLSSHIKPWNTPLAEKYLDYQEYRVLFEVLLEKQGYHVALKE